MYTDFEESLSSPVLSSCSSSSGWTGVGLVESCHKDTPNPLSQRPWDITVLINLHKIHGRLPTVRERPARYYKTEFLRLCHDYSFMITVSFCVVMNICLLHDSIATVTVWTVQQGIWSVCVLRWRRATRKPCCSSYFLRFMCLSVTATRLDGCHLGEVDMPLIYCAFFF